MFGGHVGQRKPRIAVLKQGLGTMKQRKFGLPVSEKHVSTKSQIQNPRSENEWGIESQAKAECCRCLTERIHREHRSD